MTPISLYPTPEAPADGRSALPMPDMVWIPGRTFRMGSDRHYAEEAPAHRATVDGFWIDKYPVTNDRFSRFVDTTGYRTVAELPPNPADYPGAIPELLHPGSLVFKRPGEPVSLDDIARWWQFVLNADWRHPQGPGTSIAGIERHPVVHMAYADAGAFAAWEGKELPTEAEWELASRGGLEGATYAWGEELLPGGRALANFWQGRFPHENLRLDGWDGTSPVDAFPPNAFGVYDMIGNVWEWTSDWYGARYAAEKTHACCAPGNPRGCVESDSDDPAQPLFRIPRKVLKGGSHLCAPNYCQRYRPAARFAEPIDTSTSHVGFRCVVRATQPVAIANGVGYAH